MSAMGVNTCEDHDDCLVVFTGRKCPVCNMVEEAQAEHDADMKRIGELEDEVAATGEPT